MTSWQRRLLFAFVVLGLILIARSTPEGTGEMKVTEFSDLGDEPSMTDVARVPADSNESVAESDGPTPVAKKKSTVAKSDRRVAIESKPVAPGNYKRISIDMTDYVPPEPRPSRLIASVDKKLSSSKGDFALANAVAVETEKFDSSMGEEIEEKAGFTVYKPASGSSNSFAVAAGTRPVVVNRASGAIGIVTGTVVVRLKDFEQAGDVAKTFGLEEVSSDDTIATVFFRVPPGQEIDDVIDMLRADGRVARADAEIIQAARQVH